MKKLLKAVCLATVFVMVLSFSAFAATIQLDTPEVDKEAKTAVVSGKVADPAADTQVTILVVESSTSLSSVTEDDIAYVDQAPVGEDGTFEFSLAINQENFTGDKFMAYVGGTGVSTVSSALVNFGNAKDGDVNNDGAVTMTDYQLVVMNYGQKTTAGDANGDGEVTMTDYQMVVMNYGQ